MKIQTYKHEQFSYFFEVEIETPIPTIPLSTYKASVTT